VQTGHGFAFQLAVYVIRLRVTICECETKNPAAAGFFVFGCRLL